MAKDAWQEFLDSMDYEKDRKRYTCVECGEVDESMLNPIVAPDVPLKMGGRKMGYYDDGTRYDAGYICAECMN